jgi:hypothetical protein
MKRLFPLLACALLGTGCLSTTARFVENRQGSGGIVAIPSNTNYWPTYHRDAAKKLMAEACPNGYEITTEREVAVGQEVRTTNSASMSTSVTAPTKEYQIEFRSVVQVPGECRHAHRPGPRHAAGPAAAAGADQLTRRGHGPLACALFGDRPEARRHDLSPPPGSATASAAC